MLTTIIVLVVLLLLNAVFAMSELAMMTARQSRLQKSASSGSRGAATALKLIREPTRFLSTVQIGITLIGVLAGAFGEKELSTAVQAWIERVPVLEPYSDTIALITVVLLITYFSLVLGELVPKRLALAYPETVSTIISRPLTAISFIAAAPVKLLTYSTEAILTLLRVRLTSVDDVSEEDVRSLVSRAATTGVFTPQEHSLFQRTMRAGDLVVRDLMVPRSEIIWIDENTPADHLRALIGTSPYSHFPVCRGDLDHLVGVVHIKDLISYGLLAGADFKVSVVAHTPLFVPETMPALKLLDQFKATKIHIAFVVDEHGGTMGLLTLNDVIASLVGDIGRHGEPSTPRATRRADGSWLFDGRLPVLDVLSTLVLPADAAEELPSISTAAGLALHLLGRVPTEGEHADWRGWRFEVVDMDGTRIDQILVTRSPAGDRK